MEDEKILRLVDGSPSLAAGGFLTLERAAELVALSVVDLLREVEAGRLGLACRVPLRAGAGYVVDAATLDPAGSDGGFQLPSQSPPEALAADMGGRVLSLPEGGADVARALLASGVNVVELVVLERDWGRWRWVFVPDAVIETSAGALEVRAVDVEAIRSARASTVSTERVERARTAHSVHMASRVAPAGKWATKRFNEAVDAYCTSPDGMARTLVSSHEQRHRKHGLLLFSEFMGDVVLGDIDGDMLRAFRDGPLKGLPGNKNKLPNEINRTTMKETVAALQADGRDWPLMSAGMQHERMLLLYRLFEWLAAPSRGYLKVNPAEGLRLDTGLTKAERKEHARVDTERKAARRTEADGDEDEEGRRPFSVVELQLIFGQPQFVNGHGRHAQGNGRCDPFEYWLPVMAACQGIRLKEGAQLHLADVRQVNGVWCLDINEATADKSLKNAQSARIVPLHPELIRLGFLDYCDGLRAAGFRRVFPELTWVKSDARYAKEAGRKMSAMLGNLGMPRDGSLVFHCLRHCFNNALARVPGHVVPDADDRLRAYMRYKVMGHKLPADVNASHYTRVTVDEMSAVVGAVKHEGLPQVVPFNVQFGIAEVWAALARKKLHRHKREDMGPLGQLLPVPLPAAQAA
ncbi:MAG: hypothetical protein DCF26_04500 [Burkholderiales bacterium]|nr:MAG: hypothetical protein DCF26_04500 [Burkholderiales bacterium]